MVASTLAGSPSLAPRASQRILARHLLARGARRAPYRGCALGDSSRRGERREPTTCHPVSLSHVGGARNALFLMKFAGAPVASGPRHDPERSAIPRRDRWARSHPARRLRVVSAQIRRRYRRSFAGENARRSGRRSGREWPERFGCRAATFEPERRGPLFRWRSADRGCLGRPFGLRSRCAPYRRVRARDSGDLPGHRNLLLRRGAIRTQDPL